MAYDPPSTEAYTAPTGTVQPGTRWRWRARGQVALITARYGDAVDLRWLRTNDGFREGEEDIGLWTAAEIVSHAELVHESGVEPLTAKRIWAEGQASEMQARHFAEALLAIVSLPWHPWSGESRICPGCGALSDGQHHEPCSWLIAARALGCA